MNKMGGRFAAAQKFLVRVSCVLITPAMNFIDQDQLLDLVGYFLAGFRIFLLDGFSELEDGRHLALPMIADFEVGAAGDATDHVRCRFDRVNDLEEIHSSRNRVRTNDLPSPAGGELDLFDFLARPFLKFFNAGFVCREHVCPFSKS